MRPTGIWPLIHAERAALAADLADLTGEQWATPSLCSDLTVREVLAHLVAGASLNPARWLVGVIRCRFDFDKQVAMRRAGRLLGQREHAGNLAALSDFYIATPSSSVTQLNAALAAGQDLLFTPGVYQINGTIDVTDPDTVVLGLGLATLVSNGGNTILQTADVNGIRIGGLIVDAGATNSSVLVQIGPSGSSASHAADPTVLSDVFARLGGATAGKGHADAAGQQRQRRRRRPVAVAGGPRQRRHGRLDDQHRRQRPGRQRRQRHLVPSGGRALPGRAGPVER